ncbi:hypothetical protein FBU30_002422 [Linnemannia zychae]|nr:hypothetical protein FBU30_002422 [Linnemannia zychae]
MWKNVPTKQPLDEDPIKVLYKLDEDLKSSMTGIIGMPNTQNLMKDLAKIKEKSTVAIVLAKAPEFRTSIIAARVTFG